MVKESMTLKNKKFWALSPEKQRVAVAKDVIKQVQAGWLSPSKGDYFDFYKVPASIIKMPQKLDSLFSKIKKEKGVCTVCGIGACFASLVVLGNNAACDDYLEVEMDDNWTTLEDSSISDNNMRSLLRKVFPPRQLTLIECAFEKNSSHLDSGDSYTNNLDGDQYAAMLFGREYDLSGDRLIAIMTNIIDNNGKFIPTKNQ